MAYTQQDERIAQRRLRDIYNKKNRRQRIALAEKFGYGGTDDSKLRNLRRITAQVVPQGRQVKVNQYFAPYAGYDLDMNPYLGKTPNYELDGGFHIVSSVMFVADMTGAIEELEDVETEGDALTTWSTLINTRGSKITDNTTDNVIKRIEAGMRPTGEAYSDDVRELFVKYGNDVEDSFKPVDEGGAILPESGTIIAIALSERGAQELATKIPGIAIPDPQGGEYGIALVPSRKNVKQGQKVPQVWAYTYQRPHPKAKRDRIIEYTNRAKGPMGVS